MGGIGDRACGRDVVDVAGIASSKRKARTRGRVAIDIRDRGSGVWQGALVAAGISGSEGKRQACGKHVANHTGQVSMARACGKGAHVAAGISGSERKWQTWGRQCGKRVASHRGRVAVGVGDRGSGM